nr:MAG TPA: 50S ribosomal protein L1 [Caudoviricetes sp.]
MFLSTHTTRHFFGSIYDTTSDSLNGIHPQYYLSRVVLRCDVCHLPYIAV